MRNIIKWSWAVVAASGLLLTTSCKENFGDINTDPSIVTVPDPKYLFTYSLDNLVSYKGTEWVWESLEQTLRFSQHLTTDPYELSTNINSRYSAYYANILPNLIEIRKQIDAKTDKERFQKMRAATYVVAVYQGLQVTDLNGSIPYTQAIQGRVEENFRPVYDSQKTLFDTWLTELTESIATLSANLENQENYGNADIFYHGDWTKWAKLANTLKLRIALRYEGQDKTKTGQIFKEVMEDAVGPIVEDADQFAYIDPDNDHVGGAVDYRSTRYATNSIITFLKSTNDPRLKIYFTPNDLTASALDTIKKYNLTLPSFIKPNDPLIRYQGGPADWTTNQAVAQYYKNPFNAGTNKYILMSAINRPFFAPRRNGATGTFHDYMVTSAETCFYIAELITKGYGIGVNTKGTAEFWYNKGITSSMKTMNAIAIAAQSTTGLTSAADQEIAAYLAQPRVKLDGTNNLERIYIQQYLSFMRQPTEAFTFVRRTGYPKNNSTYYPRDPFNELIPRRFWVDEPPLGTNNDNWLKAQQEQGFTPNDRTPQILSTQRLWFDKNSPAFGQGN
ncbi:SusD-like starch-binding protein associating with outer membrane [Larkinella arboricola]|uniref:SusD-like starch-binding protein associating with outer membrane n=1 Tax=Larkinella arboricola TaxID=643671 RepID=A0A327X9Z4_LARAB|nr:SusD/RagB family nutrient-binding outer membrane lipoprotein [Larkinella arboricola]RAK03078.1 SusD-like starch-binding protein associating with outer membrane [Larkinella arboricola]